MKNIIIISTLILLSGCSLFQSPCKNISRLTKKHSICFDALKKPVSLDTVLPEIKIVVEKEIQIDSAANDSLIALLDSCQGMSKEVKESIVDKAKKTILNNLKIEPLDTTIDNLRLQISIVNGKFKVISTRLESPMTVTGETEVLQPKKQGFNWNLLILIITTIGIGFVAVAIYENFKKRKNERQN